jgi:hypothetical protein
MILYSFFIQIPESAPKTTKSPVKTVRKRRKSAKPTASQKKKATAKGKTKAQRIIKGLRKKMKVSSIT